MYSYMAEFKFLPLTGRRLDNYHNGLENAYKRKLAKSSSELDELGLSMLEKAKNDQIINSKNPLWHNNRAVGMTFETVRKLPTSEGMTYQSIYNLPFSPKEERVIDIVGHPRFAGDTLKATGRHIESNPDSFFIAAPASKRHSKVYERARNKVKTNNLYVFPY